MAELEAGLKVQEFERQGDTAGVADSTTQEDASTLLNTGGKVASAIASDIFAGDIGDLRGDNLDLETLNNLSDKFIAKSKDRRGAELVRTGANKLSKRRIEELRDKNIRELQGSQSELQNLVNRGAISSFEAQASIDRQLRRMEKTLLGSLFSTELRDAVADTTGNPGTSPTLTINATHEEKIAAAQNQARIAEAKREQEAVSKRANDLNVEEDTARGLIQVETQIEGINQMATTEKNFKTLQDTEQVSAAQQSTNILAGKFYDVVHTGMRNEELTTQVIGSMTTAISENRLRFSKELDLLLRNKDGKAAILEDYDKQMEAVLALADKVKNQTLNENEVAELNSAAVVFGHHNMPLFTLLSAINKTASNALAFDTDKTIEKYLESRGINIQTGKGSFLQNAIRFFSPGHIATPEEKSDGTMVLNMMPIPSRELLIRNMQEGLPLGTGFDPVTGQPEAPTPLAAPENESFMDIATSKWKELAATRETDSNILKGLLDPGQSLIDMGDAKGVQQLNINLADIRRRVILLNHNQSYMEGEWMQENVIPTDGLRTGITTLNLPPEMVANGTDFFLKELFRQFKDEPWLWKGQYGSEIEALRGIVQNGEKLDWKIVRDNFDPDTMKGFLDQRIFGREFGTDEGKRQLRVEQYIKLRDKRISDAEKAQKNFDKADAAMKKSLLPPTQDEGTPVEILDAGNVLPTKEEILSSPTPEVARSPLERGVVIDTIDPNSNLPGSNMAFFPNESTPLSGDLDFILRASEIKSIDELPLEAQEKEMLARSIADKGEPLTPEDRKSAKKIVMKLVGKIQADFNKKEKLKGVDIKSMSDKDLFKIRNNSANNINDIRRVTAEMDERAIAEGEQEKSDAVAKHLKSNPSLSRAKVEKVVKERFDKGLDLTTRIK